MKIALCEDDSAQADMFVRLLDKTADKLGIKVKTDAFNSVADIKDELEGCCDLKEFSRQYDAYFLDIELGNDNGISLARWIKSEYKNAIIVFITSHTDYMQNAFDVHAFNYIVKPANEERLCMILNDIHKICRKDSDMFLFNIGKSIYRVDYDDIVCIYSDMRHINVVTVDGQYRTYGKIKDIKDKFPQSQFGMASSGCIINYRYISRLQSDVVWYKISNESENVPMAIARRYSKEFIKNFNDYVTAHN